jgi:hypothetical protein
VYFHGKISPIVESPQIVKVGYKYLELTQEFPFADLIEQHTDTDQRG